MTLGCFCLPFCTFGWVVQWILTLYVHLGNQYSHLYVNRPLHLASANIGQFQVQRFTPFCRRCYCYSCHGSDQVFRQHISMMHFGVPSLKPTCLWSNSWHIQMLHDGPVPKALRSNAEPLAESYLDASGKKRCVGKKDKLKESQFLASFHGPFVYVRHDCLNLSGLFLLVHFVSICERFLGYCRAYTKAFGYRMASLFPNMHEGVWGFRDKENCMPLFFRLLLKPAVRQIFFLSM